MDTLQRLKREHTAVMALLEAANDLTRRVPHDEDDDLERIRSIVYCQDRAMGWMREAQNDLIKIIQKRSGRDVSGRPVRQAR